MLECQGIHVQHIHVAQNVSSLAGSILLFMSAPSYHTFNSIIQFNAMGICIVMDVLISPLSNSQDIKPKLPKSSKIFCMVLCDLGQLGMVECSHHFFTCGLMSQCAVRIMQCDFEGFG